MPAIITPQRASPWRLQNACGKWLRDGETNEPESEKENDRRAGERMRRVGVQPFLLFYLTGSSVICQSLSLCISSRCLAIFSFFVPPFSPPCKTQSVHYKYSGYCAGELYIMLLYPCITRTVHVPLTFLRYLVPALALSF